MLTLPSKKTPFQMFRMIDNVETNDGCNKEYRAPSPFQC